MRERKVDPAERNFAVVAQCPAMQDLGIAANEKELMHWISPTTTVAPKPAPGKPAEPVMVEKVVKETFVESEMEIIQEFPPETTSDSLMADTAYVENVAASTAAAIDVLVENVIIKGFDLKALTTRRLAGGRRLGEKMSLTVDYKIKVESAAKAAAKAAELSNEDNRKKAQDAFQTTYKEKEKERTGEEPKGLEVKQKAKVDVKVEEKKVMVCEKNCDGVETGRDDTVSSAQQYVISVAVMLALAQIQALF